MMNPRFQTLISAARLQALQAEGQALLLLDASFDLADTAAGEQAYLAGHLPGAHYLHLERDLSAPRPGSRQAPRGGQANSGAALRLLESGAKTGDDGLFRGRHPLPERAQFAARLAALGLDAGTQVVCYDAQGGMYAARAWWLLRWLGHAAAAVLDGGLQAWSAAGFALETGLPPVPRAGGFTAGDSLLAPTLDADALQARLGRLRLIDARAGERFRGEVEPLDRQAGHIPGASHRFFKQNLAENGLFKSAAQLRQEFDALLAPYGAAEAVHQCGSGVTACHNLLAMAHAGLAGSALYPGSWSEWSADPRRPVARS